jgi:hypothetical protein
MPTGKKSQLSRSAITGLSDVFWELTGKWRSIASPPTSNSFCLTFWSIKMDREMNKNQRRRAFSSSRPTFDGKAARSRNPQPLSHRL